MRSTLFLLAASGAAVACGSFGGSEDGGAIADGDAGEGGAGDGASPISDGASPAEGGACTFQPSGCAGGRILRVDFTSTEMPPPDFGQDKDFTSIAHIPDGYCTPGALRVVTDATPVDESASGTIFYTAIGAFKSIRLAFAFRGPAPAQAYLTFGCAVTFRPENVSLPRATLRMSLGSDHELEFSSSFRDEDGGVPSSPVANVVLDPEVTPQEAVSWRTLVADYTIAGDQVQGALAFDGKAAVTTGAYPLPAAHERIVLECGITYADGTALPRTVDIDDVLLELCP